MNKTNKYMTDKKTMKATKPKNTKKKTVKAVEVVEQEVLAVNADETKLEPTTIETPIFTMTEVSSKEYKINFERITNFQNVLDILKALDIVFRVNEGDEMNKTLTRLIRKRQLIEVVK